MLVVAGGSGTRMGAELPKQFLPVANRSILVRTLERLHELLPDLKLVLALPEAWQTLWNQILVEQNCTVPHVVVNGGATRTLSVTNALAAVTDADCLIGIHDGVRPFISAATINACFQAAENHGAAIPVLPVVQSLRKLENGTNMAVNRADYRIVQTPQCFQSKQLRAGYSAINSTDQSDDATVVQAAGYPIQLVPGDQMNVKLTTQTDLKWAEFVLMSEL